MVRDSLSILVVDDNEPDVNELINTTREKLYKSIEMGFEEVAT